MRCAGACKSLLRARAATSVVRDLIARGHRVRALLHPRTHTAASLAGVDVELAWGDVLEPDSLRAAFRGAEVVYHLAALISIDGDRGGLVRRVNVDGARNAALASRAEGVRRHVHVSSVHAFDHHPVDVPLDETRARPGPLHPTYDRTKAAGEAAVREVIAQGLDAVIVNPTGVIGPRDYTPSRVGQMLLQLVRGRMPAASNGGFDWVDVRDVSRSLMAAAERGRTGENYLLSGHYRSVVEFFETVERVSGVKTPRMVVPRARGARRGRVHPREPCVRHAAALHPRGHLRPARQPHDRRPPRGARAQPPRAALRRHPPRRRRVVRPERAAPRAARALRRGGADVNPRPPCSAGCRCSAAPWIFAATRSDSFAAGTRRSGPSSASSSRFSPRPCSSGPSASGTSSRRPTPRSRCPRSISFSSPSSGARCSSPRRPRSTPSRSAS